MGTFQTKTQKKRKNTVFKVKGRWLLWADV